MKIIVCIDDKNGMEFNHRRQSRDAVLREEILGMVGRGKLWMNAYSRKQFAELDVPESQTEHPQVIVDEAFLEKAEAGDYCFVENLDVLPHEDRIEEIVLYRWNRVYPADLFFAMDLQNWKIAESEEFAGSSHEKITKEIYVK